jgi:hypothetical protein
METPWKSVVQGSTWYISACERKSVTHFLWKLKIISENMFRWKISASCQPGGFQGRAVPRPVASPIKTSIYWHIPIPRRTRIIVLAINIYI